MLFLAVGQVVQARLGHGRAIFAQQHDGLKDEVVQMAHDSVETAAV